MYGSGYIYEDEKEKRRKVEEEDPFLLSEFEAKIDISRIKNYF